MGGLGSGFIEGTALIRGLYRTWSRIGLTSGSELIMKWPGY